MTGSWPSQLSDYLALIASTVLTKCRLLLFCIAPFLLLAFIMVLVDTTQTSLMRTSAKPQIAGGFAIFSIASA